MTFVFRSTAAGALRHVGGVVNTDGHRPLIRTLPPTDMEEVRRIVPYCFDVVDSSKHELVATSKDSKDASGNPLGAFNSSFHSLNLGIR